MERHLDIEVSNEIEDKSWDDFLANNPSGHHVQTSLWAQVKSELGWETVRIKILDSEEIIAGAQIMIRKMKPFGAIGYIPKGPILSPAYDDQLEFLLQEIKNLARSNRLQLLATQPPEHYPGIDDQCMKLGYCHSWLRLAPTATIHLDLRPDTEEILKQMKRQTRQNIRRSEREGINIRVGKLEDLQTFFNFYQETSRRQKFHIYPENYFAKMWDIMSDSGNFVNIIAEYEGEAVSSLLIVPFGNTVTAKFLGWSGNYPKKRPNDAAFWGAICWAKNNNYQCFDMEGINRESAQAIFDGSSIPQERRCSADFFKLGYGGQLLLLPLAYDYVPNSLINWLYRNILCANLGNKSILSRVERTLNYFRTK